MTDLCNYCYSPNTDNFNSVHYQDNVYCSIDCFISKEVNIENLDEYQDLEEDYESEKENYNDKKQEFDDLENEYKELTNKIEEISNKYDEFFETGNDKLDELLLDIQEVIDDYT